MNVDRPRPASKLSLSTSIGFVFACILAVWLLFHYTGTHGRAARLQEMRRKGFASEALANEPPWVIVNGDGSLSGLGPDIDREVLASVGVGELRGQTMEYGAMIPALQAGRVDMVSSGSQDITPQRCTKVLFSEPVLCDGEAFLANSGAALRVHRYADIASLHLRVAVCGGCVEQRYALAGGVPAENVIVFPDGISAVKMLQARRVDLIALPQASLETLQRTADVAGSTRIGMFSEAPVGCSAASFRKQDVALRDAYNHGLQRLIESGRYAEVLKTYGMESRIPLLQGRTTQRLCNGG